MSRTWIHLINPFLIAGMSSFKKAVKISTYTYSVLATKQSDTFFGPIYTAYSPFHLALVKKYNDWKAHTGVQKGQTLNVNQLLNMLCPTKVNLWEYSIIGQYPKKSTNYVTLFPNGHKSFQKGDKLSRISAETQLKTNLALLNNTALAANFS